MSAAGHKNSILHCRTERLVTSSCDLVRLITSFSTSRRLVTISGQTKLALSGTQSCYQPRAALISGVLSEESHSTDRLGFNMMDEPRPVCSRKVNHMLT